MSEIPDDIFQITRNIVTDICVKRGQMIGFRIMENEYLEQAIALAILGERRRCAEIAEDGAKGFDFQSALADGDDLLVGAQGAKIAIAAAIRGQAPSSTPNQAEAGKP